MNRTSDSELQTHFWIPCYRTCRHSILKLIQDLTIPFLDYVACVKNFGFTVIRIQQYIFDNQPIYLQLFIMTSDTVFRLMIANQNKEWILSNTNGHCQNLKVLFPRQTFRWTILVGKTTRTSLFVHGLWFEASLSSYSTWMAHVQSFVVQNGFKMALFS